MLWQHLRNRQLGGHKFSRQLPVSPYFADFLCRERRLVIELDGASHDARQAEDAARDAYFTAQGYRVLRFRNADLTDNLEGVLSAISAALELPTPGPSRRREGDKVRAGGALSDHSVPEEAGVSAPPPACGRRPGGGPAKLESERRKLKSRPADLSDPDLSS